MLIYIVRHAKSIANTKKIVEWHWNSKLCLFWYIQSFFLYFKFLKNKFDVIYSSDLERCYKTAKISCMTNNIIRKRELRERYLWNNEWKHINDECWCSLNDDWESNYACWKRLENFIESLDKNNSKVLIFSHWRIISSYISLIKWYDKEFWYKNIDNIKNCWITILEVNDWEVNLIK